MFHLAGGLFMLWRLPRPCHLHQVPFSCICKGEVNPLMNLSASNTKGSANFLQKFCVQELLHEASFFQLNVLLCLDVEFNHGWIMLFSALTNLHMLLMAFAFYEVTVGVMSCIVWVKAVHTDKEDRGWRNTREKGESMQFYLMLCPVPRPVPSLLQSWCFCF